MSEIPSPSCTIQATVYIASMLPGSIVESTTVFMSIETVFNQAMIRLKELVVQHLLDSRAIEIVTADIRAVTHVAGNRFSVIHSLEECQAIGNVVKLNFFVSRA